MLQTEFDAIIALLIENYGTVAERWFTEFRKIQYWNVLKNFNFFAVKARLTDYIANNQFIPKLEDVKYFCKYLVAENDARDLQNSPRCKICENTGLITRFSDDNLAPWAFRCDCAHGARFKKFRPMPVAGFINQDNYFFKLKEKMIYKKSDNPALKKSVENALNLII